LLVETTEGGFFNRQNRDTDRVQWQEIYQSSPKHFYGDHQLKVGFDFSHSSYDGRQQFLPVDIVGVAGTTLQRIEFGAPATFVVHQNEFAWFGGDQWTVGPRLSVNLGLAGNIKSGFDTPCATSGSDVGTDEGSKNSTEGWRGIVL
jgi:outer membrane receptor protein involved in Fe transport